MAFAVFITCGVYPATLWLIGQSLFPFQANGSLLHGPDGSVVGFAQIAQPFTKDEYFQPRPSAVSYDASASGPSNLGPSNDALRNRVARALGPIVTYHSGPKAGKAVGPDTEAYVRTQIERILNQNVSAPFGGLFGEPIVNVLEVNLELRKQLGAPPA
jgi:K+-transporting ATPase ATPase C chain